MNEITKLVLLSVFVYIIWVFATYMLEGRINLLQRVDPIGRMEYAVTANILIGTIFGLIMLKPSALVPIVLSWPSLQDVQLLFSTPVHFVILVLLCF